MGTHKTCQSFNLSFIQLHVSLIGFSVILYQFRIVLTPTHSAKGLHWLWKGNNWFFFKKSHLMLEMTITIMITMIISENNMGTTYFAYFFVSFWSLLQRKFYFRMPLNYLLCNKHFRVQTKLFEIGELETWATYQRTNSL